MSLVTCHECKQQISSEAKVCPQCGAKPKKGIGVGAIVLVGIVGWIAYQCTSASNEMQRSASNPPAVKSAAEIQADKDLNTAIAAGRVLKKSAKDPSSFKMESFVIFPGGAACYEYRAKNSFGAVVPAQAVFTPPATMLTSEHDRNRFVKSWNSTCTKPGGAERAGGLNLLGVW
jgi:hypothetical protein